MNKTQSIAIDNLQNANVHFSLNGGDEKPATRLMIWTSSNGNGSHIAEQDNLKAYLEERGFFEFERDFDRVCGKGLQVFKILKGKAA